MYLEQHPDASPDQVKAAIIKAAGRGRISSSLMLPDTPNNSLFSGVGEGGAEGNGDAGSLGKTKKVEPPPAAPAEVEKQDGAGNNKGNGKQGTFTVVTRDSSNGSVVFIDNNLTPAAGSN